MTPVCPHRRYHREATHYRCLGDGVEECTHTLPLGEAETVPVEDIWTAVDRESDEHAARMEALSRQDDDAWTFVVEEDACRK